MPIVSLLRRPTAAHYLVSFLYREMRTFPLQVGRRRKPLFSVEALQALDQKVTAELAQRIGRVRRTAKAPAGAGLAERGREDSNPRLLVLETSSLRKFTALASQEALKP